jgi:2-oxoglutarate ferredoxin oxidoreductase subunit beta
MVFGANANKGIKLDGLKPVVVDISNGKYSKDDLWVHNELDESPAAGTILAQMDYLPGFPTPIGIFREYSKETYDEAIKSQIDAITKSKGKGDLEKMLKGPNTWEVN